MTRPKADTDPWLTDMVSRDREIAKTVVYGIRSIQSLLRDIRDEIGVQNAALMQQNEQLRQELAQAYRERLFVDEEDDEDEYPLGRAIPISEAIQKFTSLPPGVPPCEKDGCSLPQGHIEAHRGTMRDIRPRRTRG